MTLNSDLIKINNLQLASKMISEQITVGLHKSKRSGVGVEFDQYRHYVPGDDPKRIDWKLYARTQKHQIKESSTESPILINFIIDLSGSMNYEEKKVSRINYAKILLASLSFLGYRQNDFMNLYGLRNGKLEVLAAEGKQVFQKILYALENCLAAESMKSELIQLPTFQTKNKELLVLVSDLLETEEEFLTMIKRWAKPGKEILIYQILGKQEVDFDFNGNLLFTDLESNQKLEVSPEAIKARYLENSKKYLNDLEEGLKYPNVHFFRCFLHQPIAEVLKNSLTKIRWNF